MSQGEFSFRLTEKKDRNGDTYLFGSLKMFNSVIFVREEPRIAGEPKRFLAVVKPYQPRKDESDIVDDTNVWEEETPQRKTTGR